MSLSRRAPGRSPCGLLSTFYIFIYHHQILSKSTNLPAIDLVCKAYLLISLISFLQMLPLKTSCAVTSLSTLRFSSSTFFPTSLAFNLNIFGQLYSPSGLEVISRLYVSLNFEKMISSILYFGVLRCWFFLTSEFTGFALPCHYQSFYFFNSDVHPACTFI